jgi:hemerythrin-like domain-containing protein
MTSPTDILRSEHDLILRALTMVSNAALKLERGQAVPDAWWTDAIEWLRSFADVNHHMKEENLLFPALEKAGIPNEGGPIGVMLAEHVEGRGLIATIERGAGAVRVNAARRYVNMLRAHIDKENSVLFVMADGVLDDAAQESLRRSFQAVADELGAKASLTDARARVDTLEAALGPVSN